MVGWMLLATLSLMVEACLLAPRQIYRDTRMSCEPRAIEEWAAVAVIILRLIEFNGIEMIVNTF